MRTLINSTYITLDGVITNPQDWPSGDPDPDFGTLQTELLLSCDALLAGRKTYESFASVWQGRPDDPYSERMNEIAKYVVSSTLTEPDWNNSSVVNGDVVDSVRALKNQPGSNIVQYGFGPIAHTLMQAGLLDELKLWVHPIFAGAGGPDDLLFRPGGLARFELAEARPLTYGIVVLTYRAAAA